MKYTISQALHDEVFIIRDHSLLIDMASINRKEIIFDTGEIRSDCLATFTKSEKYDNNTLLEMTNARRDEPIIVSNFGGANRVIDGNHRLIKRISDGYETCHIVAVSPAILEQFSEPFPSFPRSSLGMQTLA